MLLPCPTVRAYEAYVHGLVVAPSHRRRGLGERLLEAAAAESSSRGKRLLSAFVAPTNRASLALFARQGFRPGPAGRRLGLIPRRAVVLLRRELR